jgi:hypothetical protein
MKEQIVLGTFIVLQDGNQLARTFQGMNDFN